MKAAGETGKMQTVLLKAGSFVLVIAAGYLLKKTGLFKTSENRTIMKLIMNVTLPAAVITSFSNYERDFSLNFCIFPWFPLKHYNGVHRLYFGKDER